MNQGTLGVVQFLLLDHVKSILGCTVAEEEAKRACEDAKMLINFQHTGMLLKFSFFFVLPAIDDRGIIGMRKNIQFPRL